MCRYKRALFNSNTTPTQLKEELRRLAQGVKEAVEIALGPHDAPAQSLLQNGSAAASGSGTAESGAGGELVRAALLEQDQATAAADTLASAEFDADAARGGAVLTYEKLRAMLDSLTLPLHAGSGGGLLAATGPAAYTASDVGLVMCFSSSSSRGAVAQFESRNANASSNGNANGMPLTRANSLAGAAPAANGTRHQRIELKAAPKARPKHTRDPVESALGKARE